MKTVFLFPGQGSQCVGMGKSFYENSAKARDFLNDASDFCKIDFKHLLFEENDKLNLSEFTQAAVVLNSLMAILALQEQSPEIKTEYALGHSLGEFSALAVQGALEYLSAVSLVNQRGKFMQDDCSKIEASMMVVLGLEDKLVEDICKDMQDEGKKVYAANYNCDSQIVVAGLKDDLLSCEAAFKKAGAKRAMLLNMSVASHCPLLQDASLKLGVELDKLLKDEFKAVISNVNAKPYTTKAQALTLLKEQLVKPVLYKQSIKFIEDEADCFIEFGAAILKGLNKKITQKETYSIVSMSDIDEVLKALK